MKKLFVGVVTTLTLALAVPAQSHPAASLGSVQPAGVEHAWNQRVSNTLKAWGDPKNGPRRIEANGDGNACLDNTVINSTYTVVKVNACVGQVEVNPGQFSVYHFAFIRCGKNPNIGGGYWSDCNFGLHPAVLCDVGPLCTIEVSDNTALLHVGTWTFRGSQFCDNVPFDYYSATAPLQGDSRGFEVRNNQTVPSNFWTGRTYVSNTYTGYPGC